MKSKPLFKPFPGHEGQCFKIAFFMKKKTMILKSPHFFSSCSFFNYFVFRQENLMVSLKKLISLIDPNFVGAKSQLL